MQRKRGYSDSQLECLANARFWLARSIMRGCKFRPKDLRRIVDNFKAKNWKTFNALLSFHISASYRLNEARDQVEISNPLLDAMAAQRGWLDLVQKDHSWKASPICVPFKGSDAT